MVPWVSFKIEMSDKVVEQRSGTGIISSTPTSQISQFRSSPVVGDTDMDIDVSSSSQVILSDSTTLPPICSLAFSEDSLEPRGNLDLLVGSLDSQNLPLQSQDFIELTVGHQGGVELKVPKFTLFENFSGGVKISSFIPLENESGQKIVSEELSDISNLDLGSDFSSNV
jgi:hypothetical protein